MGSGCATLVRVMYMCVRWNCRREVVELNGMLSFTLVDPIVEYQSEW